jgi:hypothetical protein
MPTEWFYSQDDQQKGPVSFAELTQLARSGELQPTDLVWNAGMSQWQPASTFPTLFTTPSAATGGNPYAPVPDYAPPVNTDAKKQALAGFICSLCGLLPCVGIILGAVGFIMGLQAYNKMNTRNEKEGRGYAIAAIIIGAWDVLSSIGYFARHMHGI